MSYLIPTEFVTKMVDSGESKIFMSTRDTLIRAYMAGAIGAGGGIRHHHHSADWLAAGRCGLLSGRLYHAVSDGV